MTEVHRCTHCAATQTPLWRSGPNGPKSLCNACGMRWKKGKLLPLDGSAPLPPYIPSSPVRSSGAASSKPMLIIKKASPKFNSTPKVSPRASPKMSPKGSPRMSPKAKLPIFKVTPSSSSSAANRKLLSVGTAPIGILVDKSNHLVGDNYSSSSSLKRFSEFSPMLETALGPSIARANSMPASAYHNRRHRTFQNISDSEHEDGDGSLILKENLAAGGNPGLLSTVLFMSDRRSDLAREFPLSFGASSSSYQLDTQSSSNDIGESTMPGDVPMESPAPWHAIDMMCEMGEKHGLRVGFEYDDSRLDAELDEALDRCRFLQIDSRAPASLALASSSSSAPPASSQVPMIAVNVPSQMDTILAYSDAPSAVNHGSGELKASRGAEASAPIPMDDVLFQAPDADADSSSSSSSSDSGPVSKRSIATSGRNSRPQHAVGSSNSAVKGQTTATSGSAGGNGNGNNLNQASLAAAAAQTVSPQMLRSRLRGNSSSLSKVYHSCVQHLALLCAKLYRDSKMNPVDYIRAFAHDQSSMALVSSLGFSNDEFVEMHSTALHGFFCDANLYSRALYTFRELMSAPELIQCQSDQFIEILTEDVVRLQEIVKDWEKPIELEQFARLAFAGAGGAGTHTSAASSIAVHV